MGRQSRISIPRDGAQCPSIPADWLTEIDRNGNPIDLDPGEFWKGKEVCEEENPVCCFHEAGSECEFTDKDDNLIGSVRWEWDYRFPPMRDGLPEPPEEWHRIGGSWVYKLGAAIGALSLPDGGSWQLGTYGFFGPHPVFNAWLPYNTGVVSRGWDSEMDISDAGIREAALSIQRLIRPNCHIVQDRYGNPLPLDQQFWTYFDIGNCTWWAHPKRTKR
jgi:hypothetical protein